MQRQNDYPQIREVPIPKEFRTYVSEEHFANCISCDRYLLDEQTEYVIEKVMKEGVCEVEYAICLRCVEDMRKKMSEVSLERLSSYFAVKIDFDSRYALMSNGSTNPSDFMAHCCISGKPISGLTEYQLMAHCRGQKLLLSVFPYLISNEVAEEVQDLISAQTREELDRFTDTHFGLPPELRDILRDKKVVLF